MIENQEKSPIKPNSTSYLLGIKIHEIELTSFKIRFQERILQSDMLSICEVAFDNHLNDFRVTFWLNRCNFITAKRVEKYCNSDTSDHLNEVAFILILLIRSKRLTSILFYSRYLEMFMVLTSCQYKTTLFLGDARLIKNLIDIYLKLYNVLQKIRGIQIKSEWLFCHSIQCKNEIN